MRYIFFGDENFHDDIAVRLANTGFERCADIEEASAVITFCTSQSAQEASSRRRILGLCSSTSRLRRLASRANSVQLPQ